MESKVNRKHPLTLIEVVIGALLLTMIVGMLFNSLGHSIRFSNQLEGAKKEVLERSYLQERLTEVFSSLLLKESTFYTGEEEKKPELFFCFNNGLDPDFRLCDTLKGHLFLRGKSLCLIREGEKEVKKEEILMRDVESIRFHFYDESQKASVQSWDSKQKQLPHFFVLSLNKEGQNLTFPFYIHANESGIPIPTKN